MLTELEIRNAKPKDKPYKMPDGKGLYLHVAVSGSKTWLYRYRLEGKEKLATLGAYPAMKGEAARQARAEARKLVKQGVSPTERQKEEKQANIEAAREKARREAEEQAALARSFQAVAEDWHRQKNSHLEPRTQRAKWNSLVAYVFPRIGAIPIERITRQDLVAAVRAIEAEVSSHWAGRTAGRIAEVFTFAQDSGLIDANPATRLKSVLQPHITEHRKMLPREQLPELLQHLRQAPEAVFIRSKGQPHEITKAAMLFTILTAARTIETRLAVWDEMDLEANLWHIPAERMKMRRPHTVPLSRQAAALLEFVRTRHGGEGYVFTISHGKPISENTMLSALKRGLRFDATIHGFRAAFLTEAKKLGVFYERAVGAALSHQGETGSRSDAPYDRGDYLELRKPIMQWYADWLESMQRNGQFENPADYLPQELRHPHHGG